MSSAARDIGFVGLATMGANLARNAARNGARVALYNRHPDKTRRLLEQFDAEGDFAPAETLQEFVALLSRPRAVVLMVKAGIAVDDMMEELGPLLDPGDIVVDAGNSLFSDTARRAHAAAGQNLRFIGMGVSGGEEGALLGPSMMPGGDRDAYEHIAPLLTKMAAQAAGESCCAYIGPGGAGHYVKMVHNGIEYADMQAIAEVYDLLRSTYGQTPSSIAKVFAGWRDGDLSSYLLDITVDVLSRKDDSTGGSLIDFVIDEAEQKGTGRWTAADALALGVVGTSTAAAVDARVLSAGRRLRQRASSIFNTRPPAERPLDDAAVRDLASALLATRIVAFSQGFDQLAAASMQNDWRLDMGEIAALWRGGCIIRARILDRIVEARRGRGHDAPLVMEWWFADALNRAQTAWRRVAGLGISAGVPLPVITSALTYFDGLRRERSPANLIQGLRDDFGAHGYRRFGSDKSQHSDWRGTILDAR